MRREAISIVVRIMYKYIVKTAIDYISTEKGNEFLHFVFGKDFNGMGVVHSHTHSVNSGQY